MTLIDILSKISYTLFPIFLAYFIFVILFYFLLALVGFIEGMRNMRQSKEEDYPLVYMSTTVVPVSIIIPAHNEEEWIADSVSAAVALNYPKFEVIIIDDGSTDKTFEILYRMLDLKPVDMPYLKHYKDGHVRGIYKSIKHPHVTVIHKFSGVKKAGALNAGLNIAKHDYICSIDADTVLEPDALLKVMAYVEKDPEKIIGIGCYFSLANGLKIKNGRVVEKTCSYNPILAYQNIEYIRSFIGSRIGWSRYNAMPIVAGGFAVWRRDILYKLGGFSAEFTCEDIEFTFRAHDYAVQNKDKGYKINVLPYHVGWTEGPDSIVSLISQRERWQRVTNETIWRYKYMICNPRFGAFAFLTLPYFVIYEVLGVFFEMSSIGLFAIGWAAGVVDKVAFLIFLALMILSQTFISLISIFSFVRSHRLFNLPYVCYMVLLSFVEFIIYRPIISVAKVVGTYRYFNKIKSHDTYVRTKRNGN